MSTDPLEVIQQRTIEVLGRHLHPGEPVALLDFPSHQNAGDSLIYAGIRTYLRRLAVPIRYEADHVRYSRANLVQRHPEGPILLHGGGNLGDRWEHLQEFRERVIQDFPDRPILQMPQSMEFNRPERLAQARRIFESNPNLTILLRETPSFERGTASFPNTAIEYCPDAAFGVGYLKPLQDPEHDVVMILRKDSESVERGLAGALDARVVDWGLTGPADLAWKVLSVHKVATARWGVRVPQFYGMTVREYAAREALNLQSSRRIVSSGRVVVTDRLHAAVMAALTRRSVVALDNANRKISSIYADYLHTLPGVSYVTSAEEARDAVGRLAA